MSEPEPNQVVEIALPEGTPAVVTQGSLCVVFHSAAGSGLTVNGQVYDLKDGILVPANEAIAPAIMRHKLTSGRYGLNESDIGQMIQTDNAQKGILLAPAFQHLNRKGKRVGPVVDYFAAPKDTRFLDGSKQLATYNRDIQRIADLEDVCGHRGILLPNDAAIYDAAETDPAKLALWHMPTLPLVNGRNMGSDQVNPNNMYARKGKGALRGTFTDKVGSNGALWYWSATEHRDDPSDVYGVGFTGGAVDWGRKDGNDLSSRPVRAELRPAA